MFWRYYVKYLDFWKCLGLLAKKLINNTLNLRLNLEIANLRFYNHILLCLYLCACSAAVHRMWALQRLRKLLTTEYGQSININRVLGDSEGEARSMVRQRSM